jgi:predicted SPOUT superfamily RNA methylase MTH1
MEVEEGERVTIRISSREPVCARIVDAPPPGYDVSRMDLAEALTRPDAGLRVATSRFGRPLSADGLADLTRQVAEGATVAFGAPDRGLPDILGIETEAVAAAEGGEVEPSGSDADPGFDLWLNTIPAQGSEVVRTEEAMFASLATLTLPSQTE